MPLTGSFDFAQKSTINWVNSFFAIIFCLDILLNNRLKIEAMKGGT